MNAKGIYDVLAALGAGLMIAGCNTTEKAPIQADAPAASVAPVAPLAPEKVATETAPPVATPDALPAPTTNAQNTKKAAVQAVSPTPKASIVAPQPSVAPPTPVVAATPEPKPPAPAPTPTTTNKHGAHATCGEGSCG